MEHLHQLFLDAGILMLAGMVFVFAFLGILVIFIKTVLFKLAVKFPDPSSQLNTPRSVNTKQSTTKGLSPSVVAVITAAITQYRQKNSPQQKTKK